jgi:hypothetical protein
MSSRPRRRRSAPFSIRLGAEASLLVAEEARRTRRSRNAIVEELAEEAAKTRLFPGIAFRGSPRRAWVIGTGLDVWELIELAESYGHDLARLREHHPLVTQRHLRLARAYAERFPEEIAMAAESSRRRLDDLQQLYPFLETEDT